MIRAPVEPRARVVDDPIGPVDKRNVLRIVAHLLFSDPLADVRLCDPEAIGPELSSARKTRIAPAHDAFARRRVIWKSAAGRRLKIVDCLNIKRGRHSG